MKKGGNRNGNGWNRSYSLRSTNYRISKHGHRTSRRHTLGNRSKSRYRR